MDQFLSQLPTTPFGWIATIAGIGVVFFLAFSKVRSNDMTILREANQDLRDSMKDNEDKMLKMEGEINTLIGKVATLETKNRTMEDLVVTALKQYFFENPKVAEAMQKVILAS